MSEFRVDPLFGTVSLISAERASRPLRSRQGTRDPAAQGAAGCPLCPGHESMTPPEISRRERTPGRWQSRVFANRYPAVRLEAEPVLANLQELRPFGTPWPGFGAHEVLVDSPAHAQPFWALPADTALLTLSLVRERIRDLHKDLRIQYVQVIKNHGRASGGSLDHPHFQLVGLPFIPAPVQRLLVRAGEPCRVCSLLEWEAGQGAGARGESPRKLAETSSLLAYADYSPSQGYQFSVYPKKHEWSFETATDEELSELASLCSLVLGRYERILGELSLSLFFFGAPNPSVVPTDFHWFVRVQPRIGQSAGFELATGIPIVQVRPEDAARAFREKGI